MTDIVERLRKSSSNIKSQAWEAAEEIERLTRQLAAQIADGERLCAVWNKASDEADELRAEIERLRAAVEQALDDMGEQGLSVCQQAKEMLQAALKDTTP